MSKSIDDLLSDVYTWMREPDTGKMSLERLYNWINRRPLAQVSMIVVLIERLREHRSNFLSVVMENDRLRKQLAEWQQAASVEPGLLARCDSEGLQTSGQ